MSEVRSGTFLFEDMHSDSQGVTETHTLEVVAHITSDTVEILIDGEPELVMGETAFHALEDAIISLNKGWK